MMRHVLNGAAPILLALLASCAGGPTYDEIESRIPPLEPEEGRLIIYRPQKFAPLVRPGVRIDGEVVGPSKARGFFFVDRPPGDYEIACSTEVDRAQTLRLEAAEVRFVRTRVKMGVFVGHVLPELVPRDEALEELRGLHYTGEEALLLPEPE